MSELDDHQLLAEFARCRSEAAFTELVRRYAGLVYSTAFRFCNNPHHAEEITQAVFIILARKAETLSPRVVLSGWFYQTARLTAANFVKGEIRRRHREQEAVMQSTLHETDSTGWEQIAPLLDAAMGALGETDRNAVLLRYFENRTSSEIGVALRMNEETARKRVNRALEKLRHFFVKRGVTVSSVALSGAISANSVQPISAFMVKSISAVALAKGAAASTSTLTLVKEALKIMAWTKVKTAIISGVVVLLAAGTITPIIIHHHRANASIFSSTKELSSSENAKYASTTGMTPEQAARTLFEAYGSEDWQEDRQKVATFFPPGDSTVNDYMDYRGLKVVSLGKPFKGRVIEWNNKEYAGIYVPYEIRLRNGFIKKWQLAIRCDNPEHRWYFDGGM
jgi:RNA polymerase sigma factor (sigma-70 family)